MLSAESSFYSSDLGFRGPQAPKGDQGASAMILAALKIWAN